MHFLWDNWFATGLAIAAVVVFLVYKEPVMLALQCIGHIGPGNPPEMQWTGLIAFGFICIVVAGIARFLILKVNNR